MVLEGRDRSRAVLNQFSFYARQAEAYITLAVTARSRELPLNHPPRTSQGRYCSTPLGRTPRALDRPGRRRTGTGRRHEPEVVAGCVVEAVGGYRSSVADADPVATAVRAAKPSSLVVRRYGHETDRPVRDLHPDFDRAVDSGGGLRGWEVLENGARRHTLALECLAPSYLRPRLARVRNARRQGSTHRPRRLRRFVGGSQLGRSPVVPPRSPRQ